MNKLKIKKCLIYLYEYKYNYNMYLCGRYLTDIRLSNNRNRFNVQYTINK